MRIKWQPFTFYLIGLLILTLGITLTIKADIGVGSWDALHVGLYQLTDISVGKWVMITGAIISLINAFLMRQMPTIWPFFTIIIVGLFIDGWLWVTHMFIFEEMIWRISLFAIGLIIISLGLSIYLQSKWAPNPIDQLMFAISQRTGFNLTISKTIGEVTALFLALLVNGPIGWGTLIITFLIGPLIQFFYHRIQPLYRQLNK